MSTVAKIPVTVRVARWSALHPWRAIVSWIIFVGLCLALGTAVGTRNATNADYRIGEAGRAQSIMADGGIPEETVEKVLIASKSGALDQAATSAAVQDVTQRMKSLPDVADVRAVMPSNDGNAVIVPVVMTTEGASASDHVKSLLDVTAAVQEAHPGLRIEQSGDASVGFQVDEQTSEDTAKAEQLSLPITLLILLVAFGAITAAGVPVLVALSAVGASVGLSIVSTQFFPSVGGQNNTIIMLIGMAVGVDYSLFYLRREREERARSGGKISHTAAVELAAATSGRAIIVSGFAVLASVAALFFANDIIFSSLAISVMIVVTIAMFASLTVLPALLAKLGRWVDRPRVPLLGRLTNRPGPSRLWPALLRPAVRHPVITLVVSGLALVALSLPVLSLRLSLPSNDRLPKVPAVRTYDELVKTFPMQGSDMIVAVRSGSADPATIKAALSDLDNRVRTDSLLDGKTIPATRSSADGQIHAITIGTPYATEAPEARELLRRLHEDYLPNTVGKLPAAEYAVGGALSMHDSDGAHLSEKLPLVIGILLLLTFVMMALSFRSLAIGVVSALLNLLSSLAALGALAAVFQSDWAARLLDLPPGGFIISRVPLFLFVILFGLSMDYQVFVVSRVRELALRGVPTKQAVLQGITSSAGVVTSAALVMVSVFGGFVFGGLLEIKQVGFALAVGVLLDAFIVRILILPSLMTLLGKANWWPSRAVSRATALQAQGLPVPAPVYQSIH
jgi:RND superfamily putative drug exporter